VTEAEATGSPRILSILDQVYRPGDARARVEQLAGLRALAGDRAARQEPPALADLQAALELAASAQADAEQLYDLLLESGGQQSIVEAAALATGGLADLREDIRVHIGAASELAQARGQFWRAATGIAALVSTWRGALVALAFAALALGLLSAGDLVALVEAWRCEATP